MKKKLIISLAFLSISILLSSVNFRGNKRVSQPMKEYKNVSLVESKKALLTLIDNKKVDSLKIVNIAKTSDKLEFLSENDSLGVMQLDDLSGNNIILIQGKEELVMLTYSLLNIRKPYHLLKSLVNDKVISIEQYNYIKLLVSEA